MILADFHFIRPHWLFAVLVLFFAIWLLKRLRVSQSGWTKLIPSHLSETLLEQRASSKTFSTLWPFFIGLLAIGLTCDYVALFPNLLVCLSFY